MQLRWRSIAILRLFVAAFLLVGTRTACAATATATINSISATGIGGSLGTVTFVDSARGLVITPNLSGFRPQSTEFIFMKRATASPG